MDYTGRKVRLTGPIYKHVPKESRECIVIGYTDSSKTTLKAKSSNGMIYNPFSPDTQVGECELIEETMSTTSYIGRKVKLTKKYIQTIPQYTEGEKNEGIVKNDEQGNTKAEWVVELEHGVRIRVWGPDNPEAGCILLEETNQEALDRLQLQPGDIVRVVGDDNNGNGWTPLMEKCKGQLQEVKQIEYDTVKLKIPDTTYSYWYRPQILEVVSRAVITQQKMSTETPVQQDNHTILDTAKSLIYGDRLNDYGKTIDSFTSIAVGWSEIAKTQLTPEQVGLMMVWLKICRANNDNCKKEDNLIDIAGYAGCIEKVKKGL